MFGSGKLAWIPFLVIIVLTLVYLTLYATVSNQFSLRQVCLDLGLPPDCNDKAALKEVAELGIPMLLIPGLVTVFSIGVVSGIADRLGRRHTLALGITGQGCAALGWFFVFFFPSLESRWKILVISAMTLQALSGGILVLYLAIFGFLSDISSKQPSIRTGLYISVDLIISITGVVGSQLGGFLMNKDHRIMLGLIVGGLFLNILLIYIFLPETIDDSVRKAPIDLKKANILSQIGFLFPIRSTKEVMDADHEKIVKKIRELYDTQNSLSNPNSNSSRGSSILTLPEKVDGIGSLNSGSIENEQNCTEDETCSELMGRSEWEPSQQTPYSFHNISMFNSFASEEGYQDERQVPLLGLGDMQSDQNGRNKAWGLEEGEIVSDLSSLENTHPTISKLVLSSPPRLIPHGNSILMLVGSLFLFSLGGVGFNVVDLFYLKDKYNINPADYSNVTSCASVVRFVCSFLVFPFLKKLFKTPTAEKNFLVGLFLVQAISYGLMPHAQNFVQFCIGVVVNCFAGIFPTGIIRSLSSNQVSQSLQQQVLASTVAAEVLVFVFGALGFNVIWLGTQEKRPSVVFYIWAGLSVICALLPLLISDSADDFNLRIEMTTQYTKIMSEEKEEKEKKEGGEGVLT